MDTKTKFRSLVQEMDDAQLGVMAEELAAALDVRRKRITTEDITIDRLKDPVFAAEVRAEIEAVLKGIR
jgi:hypothetical protein